MQSPGPICGVVGGFMADLGVGGSAEPQDTPGLSSALTAAVDSTPHGNGDCEMPVL